MKYELVEHGVVVPVPVPVAVLVVVRVVVPPLLVVVPWNGPSIWTFVTTVLLFWKETLVYATPVTDVLNTQTTAMTLPPTLLPGSGPLNNQTRVNWVPRSCLRRNHTAIDLFFSNVKGRLTQIL